VHWIVEHYAKKWPFDMIVLDEASSFQKLIKPTIQVIA
jgi:hypothetical protein